MEYKQRSIRNGYSKISKNFSSMNEKMDHLILFDLFDQLCACSDSSTDSIVETLTNIQEKCKNKMDLEYLQCYNVERFAIFLFGLIKSDNHDLIETSLKTIKSMTTIENAFEQGLIKSGIICLLKEMITLNSDSNTMKLIYMIIGNLIDYSSDVYLEIRDIVSEQFIPMVNQCLQQPFAYLVLCATRYKEFAHELLDYISKFYARAIESEYRVLLLSLTRIFEALDRDFDYLILEEMSIYRFIDDMLTPRELIEKKLIEAQVNSCICITYLLEKSPVIPPVSYDKIMDFALVIGHSKLNMQAIITLRALRIHDRFRDEISLDFVTRIIQFSINIDFESKKWYIAFICTTLLYEDAECSIFLIKNDVLSLLNEGLYIEDLRKEVLFTLLRIFENLELLGAVYSTADSFSSIDVEVILSIQDGDDYHLATLAAEVYSKISCSFEE